MATIDNNEGLSQTGKSIERRRRTTLRSLKGLKQEIQDQDIKGNKSAGSLLRAGALTVIDGMIATVERVKEPSDRILSSANTLVCGTWDILYRGLRK